MTGQLAHVPAPRIGETLSSFLLRLAHNHVATAHEFCHLLWPGRQFWTRDIDRSAADDLLQDVSRVTGLDVHALRNLTLRDVVKALGYPETPHGQQAGILPIGVYHRIRRGFGQQYCHVCLSERHAHLQRLWRLEFSVTCLAHGTALRDCCPACGSPFIPHRRNSLIERRCYNCNADLADSPDDPEPPLEAVFVQQQVYGALSETLEDARKLLAGSSPMTLQAAAHVEFLDGVRRLCRVAAQRGQVIRRRPFGRCRAFGWLRAAERTAVLAQVGDWLARWPDAWTEWGTEQRLTQRSLSTAYGPLPIWVQSGMVGFRHGLGPAQNRQRPKRPLTFRQLRRHSRTMADYRQARASLLLAKAGAQELTPR